MQEMTVKPKMHLHAVFAAYPKNLGRGIVGGGNIWLYKGWRNIVEPKCGLADHRSMPAMRCRSFLCKGNKGNMMAKASSLETELCDGAIDRFTRLKCFPNHVKYLEGNKALFGDISKPTWVRYSTNPLVKFTKVVYSEQSRRMLSR